jgi:type I restriction enzyme R subunit
VQDKTKIALAELIAKVNDLFEGDLTPGDKLVYVNDVIKGKLMESEKLRSRRRTTRRSSSPTRRTWPTRS